jgi:two-component system cell cycle response regulator
MERVLIVDGNPQSRTMLKQHLTQAGYETSEAETGEKAMEYIKNELPEVVLLDVMMPDMTGFQVCQQWLSTPQSDLVYIIMMSAVPEIDHKMRGFDKGADDYVAKPVDMKILLPQIQKGLEHVSEKRDTVLDSLTKLYTKPFFHDYYAQEVSRAQRYHHRLSLILGDLDHFSQLNETHGRSVGDAVLVALGGMFRKHCRRSDLPVRWGGEEFAILAPETDLMGGMMLAERIRQTIESYAFQEMGHLTISFGVATLTTNREDLIKRAEMSLKDAKKSGRNKVVSATKE